jgi:hypothetical protein
MARRGGGLEGDDIEERSVGTYMRTTYLRLSVVDDWGVLGGLRYGWAGQIEARQAGRHRAMFWCSARAGPRRTALRRRLAGASVSEQSTGMRVAMLGLHCELPDWSESEVRELVGAETTTLPSECPGNLALAWRLAAG